MKKLIAILTIAAMVAFPSIAGASTHHKAKPKHHKAKVVVVTAAQKYNEWYLSQGQSAQQALEKDFNAIAADAGSQNDVELGTDCQALRSEAQVLMATTEPIGVKTDDHIWTAALTDFEQGGTVCVAGINDYETSLSDGIITGDPTEEINQATSDFSSGTALIAQLASAGS